MRCDVQNNDGLAFAGPFCYGLGAVHLRVTAKRRIRIMPLDRTFYFFMAVVGILAGFVLARSPEAGNLAIKPVFWILIAVGAFDLVTYLRGRAATGGMLAFNARILGFAIGIVWMMLIPWLAGTPVRYL